MLNVRTFGLRPALLVMLIWSLASTASAANVTLSLMMPNWRANRVDEAKEIAAWFERENPDIKIDLILTGGNFVEKAVTMAAAGQLPDIVWQGRDHFLIADLALDLNPFVERDNDVNASDYFTPLWNAGVVEGRRTAAIAGGLSTVTYYNTDIFDKAGMAYPAPQWTWDEFMETGQKLTRDTNNDGEPETWGLNTWGGYWPGWSAFYNGPWIEKTPTGWKASLDSPANRKVLGDLRRARVVDFTDYHRPVVDIGSNFDAFARGRTATWNHHNTSVANLSSVDDINWNIVRLPTLQLDSGDIQPVSLYSVESMVVAKTTRHPDEAWRFIKFWLSPKFQRWAAGEGHFLPSARAAADVVPHIIENKGIDFKEFFANLEGSRGWHHFPHPAVDEAGSKVGPIVRGVTDKPDYPMPVEQALKEGDRLINAILSEY